MPKTTSTIALIPARMASTRLPGKPLANIAGKPMILQVLSRAQEAGIARVVVTTDSREIIEVVEAAGGEAVLTSADHTNGSDRNFEALEKIDPDRTIQHILNIQGDLPTIDPESIKTCAGLLNSENAQISTVAAEISLDHEKTNPNVVKVVGTPISKHSLRALYFTRATAPHGNGPLYHHIGLYGYTRTALETFVKLPKGTLEIRESLEQLRALEAGMRIDVGLVDTVPLGVDTQADLDRANALLGAR